MAFLAEHRHQFREIRRHSISGTVIGGHARQRLYVIADHHQHRRSMDTALRRDAACLRRLIYYCCKLEDRIECIVVSYDPSRRGRYREPTLRSDDHQVLHHAEESALYTYVPFLHRVENSPICLRVQAQTCKIVDYSQ